MKNVLLMTVLGLMAAANSEAAPKKIYANINCMGVREGDGLNDYAKIKVIVESVGMMRTDGTIADATEVADQYVNKYKKLDYTRFSGGEYYGSPLYMSGNRVYSKSIDSLEFNFAEGESYSTGKIVNMLGVYHSGSKYNLKCFAVFMNKPHKILDNTN